MEGKREVAEYQRTLRPGAGGPAGPLPLKRFFRCEGWARTVSRRPNSDQVSRKLGCAGRYGRSGVMGSRLRVLVTCLLRRRGGGFSERPAKRRTHPAGL